jgi:hypothetical protein
MSNDSTHTRIIDHPEQGFLSLRASGFSFVRVNL